MIYYDSGLKLAYFYLKKKTPDSYRNCYERGLKNYLYFNTYKTYNDYLQYQLYP